MKILFDHHVPFAVAHGGLQVQIQQTRAALLKLGVEVEFLRWYDGAQTGDVLHYFGRVPGQLLGLARDKGMKVVLAELLTEQGSRTPARLKLQKWVARGLEKTLPRQFTEGFNWQSYRLADACVALTSWEAQI